MNLWSNGCSTDKNIQQRGAQPDSSNLNKTDREEKGQLDTDQDFSTMGNVFQLKDHYKLPAPRPPAPETTKQKKIYGKAKNLRELPAIFQIDLSICGYFCIIVVVL